MKKTIFALIATIISGLVLTSCQKECNCYDYTSNIKYSNISVYSRSDCRKAKYDIIINPSGHEMECFYENK